MSLATDPSICEQVCQAVESLDLNLREYPNRYTGECPIHGGDNRHGFTIYKDTGVWRCFTNNCHELHGCSLNGLLRALGRDAQVVLPYGTGNDIHSVFLDNIKKDKTSQPFGREQIRSRLQIPAPYFTDRGFAPRILDKYDVGLCTTYGKMMYKRCVVPIYDLTHQYLIGCTGRATGENAPKWLHDRFSREKVLYNAWYASSFIKTKKTAVLVEGPGDIWKLEEAGVHCGLAILGTALTAEQCKLLARLGAMNVVLLLDNDDAGKKATATIAKQLKNLYNIEIPVIGDFNDVGDMPADAIKQIIRPIVEKFHD